MTNKRAPFKCIHVFPLWPGGNHRQWTTTTTPLINTRQLLACYKYLETWGIKSLCNWLSEVDGCMSNKGGDTQRSQQWPPPHSLRHNTKRHLLSSTAFMSTHTHTRFVKKKKKDTGSRRRTWVLAKPKRASACKGASSSPPTPSTRSLQDHGPAPPPLYSPQSLHSRRWRKKKQTLFPSHRLLSFFPLFISIL